MRRIKPASRQGAVLVCVIACLAVSTVLIALSVQAALRSRREVRLQLQLRQTELLCEAGVMRAALKLRDDSAYSGEVWTPAMKFENYHTAAIKIDIQPQTDSATENQNAVQVTVTAKLDSYLDNDGPMQRSHQFLFQKTEPTSTENP